MDEVYVRARTRSRFPVLHLLLFLATVASTVFTGTGFALGQRVADAEALRSFLGMARAGLPFAASLVGILLVHEMGHYLLARRYRVDATLPFFIPFPLGVGTLGAVIRIRSPMPSRRAVLDIGVAGPIAGFVLAVPLLLWGYAHSPVAPPGPAPGPIPSGLNLVRHLFGVLPSLGQGSDMFFGKSLVSALALKLTHPGLPPGAEVVEHPVAIAAWFGLYVTTINLLPIGQLDGGHVLYALFGRERAQTASRALSYLLLVLGVTVSWTWVGWWLITRLLVGTHHPAALVEEPLTPGRRALAIFALVLFAITFAPVPIR
ncbi:MAG TPA: site-2 protease family protein [Anaeromyxobacter sp.]|nr:site-2 protease family protein [Anaeromyxobacter sp.]